VRAYELSQRLGDGSEVEDWLTAESQLRERLQSHGIDA
jgi:hypothetical protein